MRVPVKIECLSNETQFKFLFNIDGYMVESKQFYGIPIYLDEGDEFSYLPAYVTQLTVNETATDLSIGDNLGSKFKFKALNANCKTI